jgi:hypothetical protein
MSGLIKWKRVSIVGVNPDVDSVYVGVDSSDGQLYVKDSAGTVTKYVGTGTLATVATTGNHTDLSNIGVNTHAQIDTHIANTSNPHSVTKAQVGLGNCDDTSDANKPVSTAQQTALNLKADLSLIGANNGIAGLDSGGKVPAAQLPSFVDDVIEAANFTALPGTGEVGKIYVTLDNNKTFRWSGSAYVEISASPGSTDAVTEGVTNLYFTTARVLETLLSGLSLATGGVIAATDSILIAFGKIQKQITDNLATLSAHIANTSNPHATTKTQVGLSNVPNTDATQRSNHLGTQLASTISDFASAALSTVLTGITFPYDTAVTAADSILTAIGKLQGQIDTWTELVTLSNLTNSSATTLTNITDLGFSVVNGRSYYIEITLMYQSATTVNGITLGFNTSTSGAGNFSLLVNATQGNDGTGSLYSGHINSFGDLVTIPSVQQSGVPFIVNMKGIFVATASGVMLPQFRSENTGTQVTMLAGSCILIREFQ